MTASLLSSMGAGAAASSAGYAGGPGDVTAFAFWWGLRGYTIAKAVAGTTKSIRVRRASDNTESDLLILAAGGLDLAAAATFAGTDTSGNATSSGTSVALTGLATAAHVGSTIAGAGFAADTCCVSVGALVAGAQTVTTNLSQTIAVAVPVVLTYGLYATKLYDQVGSTDISQATSARQPQLFPGGGPSSALPYLGCTSSFMATAAAAGSNQPLTTQFVGMRTGNIGTASILMYSFTNDVVMDLTAADTFRGYAGTVATTTATDNVWHNLFVVFNGASSVLQVDATATGSVAMGGNGYNNNLSVFARDSTPTQPFAGKWQEMGFLSGAMSSGNRNAINSQVHAYGSF